MSQPWLSVLIPTYNGEKFLPSALDSILAQGDSNIECIVVDDGSTDSTLSILATYKTRLPITILQRERQGNWVANTNYALSFAKGEYVCFLHQDDLWFKNRLSTIKRLTGQFPDVGFFLHSSRFVGESGNDLGLWPCPLPVFPKIIEAGGMTENLLIQNFISIPAPIFKKEIALKVGGLDDSLWYTADWDLWLKISTCSKTLYYPEPLSSFRVHLTSQTIARSSYLKDFRKQMKWVIKKHFTLWEAPDSLKKKIFKIAIFSFNLNALLAGTIHQKKTGLSRVLILFLRLGPAGWFLYLRNSRIFERVLARLRAQINIRA